jgi:hypothetical protein
LPIIDDYAVVAGRMHRVVRFKRLIVDGRITNPPRRGGPPCPPARIDALLPIIDDYAVVAGRMHRVVRFKRLIVDRRITNLHVGADRCVRPHLSIRFCHLLMSMLRLPGGCFACVPISPDVTKIPFGARFGFAGLSRDAFLWVDHHRWSRLGHLVTICCF